MVWPWEVGEHLCDLDLGVDGGGEVEVVDGGAEEGACLYRCQNEARQLFVPDVESALECVVHQGLLVVEWVGRPGAFDGVS